MPSSFVFRRDLAVARRDRVAGVEHHLAGELAAVVLADLRIGAIGHGDEDDVAERDRFGNGARLGERAEPLHQRGEFLGMAGREHHGMTGLDPERSDRAADMAGADDADFQRRRALSHDGGRETAKARLAKVPARRSARRLRLARSASDMAFSLWTFGA